MELILKLTPVISGSDVNRIIPYSWRRGGQEAQEPHANNKAPDNSASQVKDTDPVPRKEGKILTGSQNLPDIGLILGALTKGKETQKLLAKDKPISTDGDLQRQQNIVNSNSNSSSQSQPNSGSISKSGGETDADDGTSGHNGNDFDYTDEENAGDDSEYEYDENASDYPEYENDYHYNFVFF